ncbi:unnamed protein product [Prunus armeniaca]
MCRYQNFQRLGGVLVNQYKPVTDLFTRVIFDGSPPSSSTTTTRFCVGFNQDPGTWYLEILTLYHFSVCLVRVASEPRNQSTDHPPFGETKSIASPLRPTCLEDFPMRLKPQKKGRRKKEMEIIVSGQNGFELKGFTIFINGSIIVITVVVNL